MDQGCIPNIHSSDTAIFMHNEFYTNCASCLTATSEVSDISGFSAAILAAILVLAGTVDGMS